MNILPVSGGFASEAGAAEAPTVDVLSVIAVLRRQSPIVAAGAVLMVALACIYVAVATPLFTASATVMIDTRQNQFLQKQNIMDEGDIDTSGVDSQVEVVASENVARNVIRNLQLDQDDEFIGEDSGPVAAVRSLVGGLKRLIGGGGSGGDLDTPERRALRLFADRLSVKRVGLTYVLTISFTSEDPVKAAKIANAVAEAYINGELEAKYQSAKSAGTWLQTRLTELRTQATEADQKVQAYRAENNLVDTSRGTMTEQQLAELNSQLITAKAATAEARARLDRITSVVDSDVQDMTVSEALSSPIVSRLRAQYLDLSARASQFSARYGASHEVTINLQSQMQEIRKSISDELRRMADAYKSDYEIALARQSSLQTSLDELVGTAQTNGEAQVTLRNLESSAESYRTLYDSFLQKAQETTQQESFPVTDARVLSSANPPLIKSSPPRTLVVLGGAFMLGLVFGSAAAFGREFLVDVFRSVDDVERATGLPCLGVLPLVENPRRESVGRKRQALARFFASSDHPQGSGDIHTYVLDAPFSRFTETLRHVKVSIDSIRMTRDVRVIGVCSSIPREGKSVVASNLASLVATLGQRTLLIDGDMRVRTLTAALAGNAREGLLQALTDPQRLSKIVRRQSVTHLDFLPCVVEGRFPEAAEILGSAQMRDLLDRAKNEYSYIFVDLPPILPVVDAKAAAHLLDAFVFIVDWGRSRRSAVLECLSSVETIRSRMVGIVLNKADPVVLRRIEAYKDRSFLDYYSDEKGGSRML